MANDIRDELSRQLLGRPYERLSPQKRSVIDLMADRTPTRADPALSTDERTFWERLADEVARVGGSWSFIFAFGVCLAAWMGLNLFLMIFGRAFDPYPFIFLNLMLSTLAAIQAPVIMMSQNRQAAKDRQAAEHDYVVNLRAELEIMRLHDKLDEMRDRELREALELLRQQVTAIGEKLE
ncbi:MAG TPA: DUF1003 domain-containing protein [Caulobacteraceae bacterium]